MTPRPTPCHSLLALALALALAPGMPAPAAAAAGSAGPEWFPPTAAGWPGQTRDGVDVAPYLAFHKARAMQGGPVLAMPPTSNQQAWDATAYDLDLAPNTVSRVLWGSARTRGAVVSGPLLSVELDFEDVMVVDSVQVAGAAAPFTHATDLLTVTLDRAYLDGESFDLTVWYHGTPSAGGFGSVFYIGTRNSKPLVWTLSEPYGARAWWPCKDHPDDKADSVSVRVKVPSPMRTASNGRLVEGSDDGTWAIRRWVERHPISTYLVSIASYAYTTSIDWYRPSPADSMEIQFYLFPESAAGAAVVNAKVKGMLAAYAARFGPYPFLDEKYGEAQFTWGGGMEHQTITSLGNPSSETVVCHELAHQWWGDWVTCRDFHHVWLNEGFATYGEAVWAEAVGGMTAYRNDLSFNRYYGAGSVYVPNDDDVQRIFSPDLSYNKGSWVLHMLRHVMSDTLFFQALRTYGQQYACGTAVTEDFRAVCEQVAGRDLGRFFQEWVYGEYYPQYRWRWSSAPAGGGWDVSVTLEQTQTWQLFWMPVDVTINMAGGSETFVAPDSLPVQTFTFHVTQAPQSVQIDKDEWVLRTVTPMTTDVAVSAPPERLELRPPRPNPTRGEAMLVFTLPQAGAARLTLFDVSGARVRELASGGFAAGPHAVRWDGLDGTGRPVRPGLYWALLEAAGERRTQRVVVMQ